MDRNTAMALLSAQCAAGTYPLLSTDEIGMLLDATTRWTIWAAATTYEHGAVVIPTVRNGHTYQAIVNQQYSATPAGVSGAVEPIWPLFTNPQSTVGLTRPYWGGFGGPLGNYAVAMVQDNTLIWQEAGPDSADPWNLRLAAYNGWLQKAGKASADYAIRADNDTYARNTPYEHCMQMSCRYAPTGVA